MAGATTSAALPASCPLCGYLFGLADVPTQETHYIAHILLLQSNAAIATLAPAKPTPDW